jgi:hypothetical protein
VNATSGVLHPLVHKHPITGKTVLFLHLGMTGAVIEMRQGLEQVTTRTSQLALLILSSRPLYPPLTPPRPFHSPTHASTHALTLSLSLSPPPLSIPPPFTTPSLHTPPFTRSRRWRSCGCSAPRSLQR